MGETKMTEEYIQFISYILEVSIEDLNEERNLFEDLEIDSLTFTDLLSELEDEYNIEFEDGRINSILTIGDLCKEIDAMGA